MTMRQITFLFALLLATGAPAAELSRCGTDAFGNAVCMDKDGVLISSPSKKADERKRGERTDATVPADPRGESAERDDSKKRPRCGIDPFGNTVCRQ